MGGAVSVRERVDPDLVASLLERYLAAQLTGDRRQALGVVVEYGLRRDVPVQRLYLDVVQAAQYRIGELWQQNRISVAQEHLATAISQVAVAELYQAMEPEPSNGRRVLVSCVGGELHDLGTRMTADFFEMAGFDVRYLGANVPTQTLVDMVREDRPDLLVASVTMAFHLEELRKAVASVRSAMGDQLRLAVGGHAFTWAPKMVDEIGADVYGRTAAESVAVARRVFGIDPA